MSHLHKMRLAQINDAVDDLAVERNSIDTAAALVTAMSDTVTVKPTPLKKVRVASRIPSSVKRKR